MIHRWSRTFFLSLVCLPHKSDWRSRVAYWCSALLPLYYVMMFVFQLTGKQLLSSDVSEIKHNVCEMEAAISLTKRGCQLIFNKCFSQYIDYDVQFAKWTTIRQGFTWWPTPNFPVAPSAVFGLPCLGLFFQRGIREQPECLLSTGGSWYCRAFSNILKLVNNNNNNNNNNREAIQAKSHWWQL